MSDRVVRVLPPQILSNLSGMTFSEATPEGFPLQLYI